MAVSECRVYGITSLLISFPSADFTIPKHCTKSPGIPHARVGIPMWYGLKKRDRWEIAQYFLPYFIKMSIMNGNDGPSSIQGDFKELHFDRITYIICSWKATNFILQMWLSPKCYETDLCKSVWRKIIKNIYLKNIATPSGVPFLQQKGVFACISKECFLTYGNAYSLNYWSSARKY